MTILLIVFATAVALIAAGAIYQAAGLTADRRRYPAPGRMIDIGGQRKDQNIAGSWRWTGMYGLAVGGGAENTA